MKPTPNPPANAGEAIADIAREAAILMHENSYFRNGILTPNAFIDAATAEIRKAIERDRAGRDAELESVASVAGEWAMECASLKKQLAERDTELNRLREELGKSIDRELVQAKIIAEREVELAEHKAIVISCCAKSVDDLKQKLLHEMRENNRLHLPAEFKSWEEVWAHRSKLQAKLAEQSAELAQLKKTADRASMIIGMCPIDSVIKAVAVVDAALAGGRGLS